MRSHRDLTRGLMAIGLWALAALVACSDVDADGELVAPPPPAGRTEAAPEPETDDVLKAGLVDCTARRDTGYDRGRAFAITVVTVDGKPVERRTANAFALMRAEAARAGVNIRVVSGFRTYAQQAYLYDCYRTCRCNQCNLAAAPGYSNHNSGYALDLNTEGSGVYTWLARNAGRFGFLRTVPSEDWHWEYLGGGPAGGPCTDAAAAPTPTPAPASSVVRFVGYAPDAAYSNGQWLKVQADPRVHHVRYRADGHAVGASEDRADNFAVRVALNTLGVRNFEARAFDIHDRLIGEATLRVRITAGEPAHLPMSFRALGDGGWYRNGLDLRVDAPSEVVRVTYRAGPWALGESGDADEGHPLRVAFSTLGWRVLTAEGYDARGRRVAVADAVVRVLPGEDADLDPAVAFVAPTPDSRNGRSVDLRVIGSDRIARVRFTADGWNLGEAPLKDGRFDLPARFTEPGRRTLKAVGVDERGTPLAEGSVEIEVR